MILRAALVCFFYAAAPQILTAQILSVCEVLDRLSDLNGKEVQVRGAWFSGDTGSILWASPACEYPLIRDGWIWQGAIEISPSDLLGSRDLYRHKKELESLDPSAMVFVTITGTLNTQEHFKLNKQSHLPIGYSDLAAAVTFSKADDFESIRFGPGESGRFMRYCRFPSPVKVRR